MSTDSAQVNLEAVSLSPRVREILARIQEPPLRDAVQTTIQLALAANGDLHRLHLPQDHFEEGAAQVAQDKHGELAPYVLAAVASINRLLAHIAATFPPPAGGGEEQSDDDFDLEFDLVDGPTGEAKGLSGKPSVTNELSPQEQVADAAHAYGGMLRSRLLSFADRLEFAVGQADRWPLLAELDDYQHKLSKAVQGVLFGILGIFAQDARRDEILPEYRSGIGEAVALRSALADLTHHVNRFNTAIAQASSDHVVPLVVALSDRLARFAARPEYRTLRAEDKKAVIDFRAELYQLRYSKDGIPMARLRLAVEGFSKFLESMSAINHREVLVLHDRQRLEDALERLSYAADQVATDPRLALQHLGRAVESLDALHGRSPELDLARRNHRAEPPALEGVGDCIQQWIQNVQGTLATVG